MGLTYQLVTYNHKDYAIVEFMYNNIKLPVILDYKDFAVIDNLQKKWKCNEFGFISCIHEYGSNIKEVFMHEVVMALRVKEENKKTLTKPILHINRIGLDNRRENLIYDVRDKETNKNLRKKKRTVDLPENSGINPDEIPTYIWYLKPSDTHGSRFAVEIGDISWKTTSSNKVSLRYKLEEAKAYLRSLKKYRPNLFEEYCMNGEYTRDGKILLSSFYNIIYKAGYNHIKEPTKNNITDQYLKPHIDELSDEYEKKLLKKQQQGGMNSDSFMNKRRRLIDNLPKDSGLTINDLPEYCYYRKATQKRGDYFIVNGYPNQRNQTWRSSCSKSISTFQKYEQMLEYLNHL